jgi:hypothetical protein
MNTLKLDHVNLRSLMSLMLLDLRMFIGRRINKKNRIKKALLLGSKNIPGEDE